MPNGPVDLIVCPDYRAANPYQSLLEASLHPRFAASYASPAEARTYLRQKSGGEPVLLHVHWEDHVYRDAVDAPDGMARVEAFLEELGGFVDEGGGLVWTVHNLEPHVRRNTMAQRRLVETLGALAHRVTAHGLFALSVLAARGVAEGKLALVPHGNYVGVYGAPASQEAARSELGLDPEARIALMFGRLEAYKGIDRLLSAFRELDAPGLIVAIVGKAVFPVGEHLASLPPGHRERVLFHPGFLAPERLALWLAAADAAVLPYEEITTSGATMLALSYGRPVIVPSLAGIEEVVTEGREALMFRRGETASLAEALGRFAALDRATLEAMGAMAMARARMFPWAISGVMMSGLYADVAACLGARRRPIRF